MKLKISQEHACKIDKLKWDYLNKNGLTLEKARENMLGAFRLNPKIKSAETATRWELARLSGVLEGDLLAEMYGYMDDSHINNALKRIWGI